MSPPFRVMIDARMLLGRFAGVCRVVTQLVNELAGRDDLRVVALCGREPFADWVGRADIDIVLCDFSPKDRTADRRLFWEETKLPKLLRRANVDLFHATWNSGVPARCPVPAVLTIHDLIPWDDPRTHFATLRQRLCYRYAVRASARRARRVTTVSDYTRLDVLARLKLSPERVVTIHNGVKMPSGYPNASQTTENNTTGTPYVLYVGGHEPRKNVAGVLKAMQRFWETFDPGLELRMTGDVGSLSADASAAYRRLPSGAPVCFLGAPNDGELARQYASARALLILSHQEGFGLPVLEAMAHGCPVVAARRGALPEVVGHAGVLVDPEQSGEVADAIHALITCPSSRERVIQKGRLRARDFGWDRVAERMYRLYHSVVRECGRRTRPAVLPRPFATVPPPSTH